MPTYQELVVNESDPVHAGAGGEQAFQVAIQAELSGGGSYGV